MIDARGPLPVADFMKMALMHPKYGFYQKNNVIGKEEALSEAQETYYELIKDSASVNEAKKTLVEKAVAEKKSQISIKYLLMGLFGGLVVSCGFWGLRYIFSNRLLDAEEMQNRFGGILFGFLEQKSLRNRKKLIAPKDQQLEAIAARIELYCKQNGIEKIGLIGSSTELLHGEEVKKIKEFLSLLCNYLIFRQVLTKCLHLKY